MPSATEEPKLVYYHAGGVPGSRPILTGAAAKPTFTKLPEVDVSKINGSLEDRKRIAVEVGKACREIGFFCAVNHGIPDEVVGKTFEEIAAFFALPVEEKMETHINQSESIRGYEALLDTKLDSTSKGDRKEAFLFGDDPTDEEQGLPVPADGSLKKKNQWPANHPEFRAAMYQYYSKMLVFSRQLLHVFALALDMPEDFFDQYCETPMTAIRALHYPPQDAAVTDADKAEPGIGAHTDYCMFTLVCQSPVPGLQVLNDNGFWVDAPPKPGSFVVNIGDFLMQVTGKTFQSTVHRVVNLTGERRYSMPFFFSPDPTVTMPVLPQYAKAGEPTEVHVGEYFTKRLYAARYKHPASLKWRAEQEAKAAAA